MGIEESMINPVTIEDLNKMVDELAEFLHNEYEVAAFHIGWKTQADCTVAYHKLPEKNRQVMRHVAIALLQRLAIGRMNIVNWKLLLEKKQN